MRSNYLLRLVAYLSFMLALAHILCMPWLRLAFRLYGIEDLMNQIASYGCYWPYLITILIAICFTLCGLYALSAAGCIRKLPLLWFGIFSIAAIFLFRAGIGCYWIINSGQYQLLDFSSVGISGGIGLLYLIGGIQRLNSI